MLIIAHENKGYTRSSSDALLRIVKVVVVVVLGAPSVM
jgi:hypothetical protein